jgi:hypothetical protein
MGAPIKERQLMREVDVFRMVKEHKFGLMEVNTKEIGLAANKMEKEKNRIKSKDMFTLVVGAMEQNADTERKHGTMDRSMKESGKMIHNQDKDNSLDLIKEFTLVAGEIINYMGMENSHGLTVRNLQDNMNSI